MAEKQTNGVFVPNKEIYDKVMDIHREVVGGEHSRRIRRLEAVVLILLLTAATAIGDLVIPGGIL